MSAAEEVSPAIPLLQKGDVLDGRYRIESYLGGGGMACVYRAMHTGLEQPVAVKVLAEHVRMFPGVTARFMREARAATRLKGEHVVRVFDVGTTVQGAPYLVMELLEGKDLACLLDEGTTWSVAEAIDYTLQACEALAEVHGLGIVHRDLKPANLFVTRGADGRAFVKLIDFGISRFDSPLSPADAAVLTAPEMVMGSPRYMSPEQMESSKVADSRSDIWGLGAILYEMLTGETPFEGDTLLEFYAAATQSTPKPPSTYSPEIPSELDEVILRCLRTDPAARYADVVDLAAALAPFGDEAATLRAESIERVLQASRARLSGARHTETSQPNTPISRIRRRARWKNITMGAAGAGLFICLLLAAHPLVRSATATSPAYGIVEVTNAHAPAPTPVLGLPTPAVPSRAANDLGEETELDAGKPASVQSAPASPPVLWQPPAHRDEKSLFEDRK